MRLKNRKFVTNFGRIIFFFIIILLIFANIKISILDKDEMGTKIFGLRIIFFNETHASLSDNEWQDGRLGYVGRPAVCPHSDAEVRCHK